MAKAADRRAGPGHLRQLPAAAGCHRVEVRKVRRTDFSFSPSWSLFPMLCLSPQGPLFEHLPVTCCIITYSKMKLELLFSSYRAEKKLDVGFSYLKKNSHRTFKTAAQNICPFKYKRKQSKENGNGCIGKTPGRASFRHMFSFFPVYIKWQGWFSWL